jgi:hypothetical protein
MRKSIPALTLAAVAAFASVAQALPAITVGDYQLHQLPVSSLTQTDVLSINYDPFSGGGNMQYEQLYISVADEGNGGLGTADPGEPFISNVDVLTGTVWASNNSGPNYTMVNNQVWSAFVSTSTGQVSATGKAFTITIDRNGAPAGSIWGLRVFIGVPALDGPYSSNWSPNGNVVIPFATQDTPSGWQGVTGVPDGSFQYVPEPSSIVLGLFAAAGLGAVAIRRRSALAPMRDSANSKARVAHDKAEGD